jgi:hypothetical protein
MKYIIDIDDTICTTVNKDYFNSVPIKSRINNLNLLYDKGHEIHYWTARGSSSGIDWTKFTLRQLDEWGCKYTTAKCGKPSYDFWVDDKAINDSSFFRELDLDLLFE